jgi:glucoside 3-dehydrogenase (cytochrome c) hitch-hiker subunit
MKRRQLIKVLSLLAGGSISPSLLAAMAEHAHTHHQKQAQRKPVTPYRYQQLAPEQVKLIIALVDTILPRTGTPGGSDVGVPAFIDRMLFEWYDVVITRQYIRGFTVFTELIDSKYGHHFPDIPQESRHKEVQVLDQNVMEENSVDENLSQFYQMTKELTLIGYYTSSEGMKEEINYMGPIGEFNFDASGPPGAVTRY